MRISSGVKCTPQMLLLLFFFLLAMFLNPGASSAVDNTVPRQSSMEASQDQAGKDALLARVNEFWKYKIAGDLEKAYAYEDPETVAGTTVSDYVRAIGGAVKWLDAQVSFATIAGDHAKVLVEITYYWTFVKGEGAQQGVKSEAAEFWRLVDGVWYHRFVDPRKMRGPGTGASSEQPQNPAAPEPEKKP